MLAIHLMQHEDTPQADRETREAHLQEHLGWTPTFAERVVRRSTQRGTIERRNGHLALTPRGRSVAKQALERT